MQVDEPVVQSRVFEKAGNPPRDEAHQRNRKDQSDVPSHLKKAHVGTIPSLGQVKKCKMSLHFAPRTPHSIRIDVIQGRTNDAV